MTLVTFCFLLGYNVGFGLLSPLYALIRSWQCIVNRWNGAEILGYWRFAKVSACSILVVTSSVGEYKAWKALRNALDPVPEFTLLFSSFSLRSVAANLQSNGVACHLIPLDLIPVWFFVLLRLRPSVIVLIEQECPPNLVFIAHILKIPVVRFDARAAAYMGRVRDRIVLPLLTATSTVSDEDAYLLDRLRGNGGTRVIKTGYSKVDAALSEVNEHNRARIHSSTRPNLHNDGLMITLGSIRPKEIQPVLDCLLPCFMSHPNIVWVIAPRYPAKSKHNILMWAQRHSLHCQTWNSLRSEEPDDVPKLIIIETIGDLMKWYGLSDIAIVGGGFSYAGGHSVIEPAAWGVPTVFGPRMTHWKEFPDGLVRAEGAIRVSFLRELADAVTLLISDSSRREHIGIAAREYVESQFGAAERNAAILRQYTRSLFSVPTQREQPKALPNDKFSTRMDSSPYQTFSQGDTHGHFVDHLCGYTALSGAVARDSERDGVRRDHDVSLPHELRWGDAGARGSWCAGARYQVSGRMRTGEGEDTEPG